MPQSETIEHSSPLPRSRRVAAIYSDISGFSMGEINDRDEEMIQMKNQRIQSSMSKSRARTITVTAGTRKRKGKKEEAPGQAVDPVVVDMINQFLPASNKKVISLLNSYQ